MKITSFQELWRAVNRIKIDVIAKTEVTIFENEGLYTDLTDVYSSTRGELFSVLKDGTIRKTIVHICNISNYKEKWELPKFHIFECKTLKTMRKNSRMHRYKKASRIDGKFWIIRGDSRKCEKLNICRYDCLKQYNKIYRGSATINTFDIKQYMEKPMQRQCPYIENIEKELGIDMTTIPSSYEKDWETISNERKTYHKWVCQGCFYDLSSYELKEYLHTHILFMNEVQESLDSYQEIQGKLNLDLKSEFKEDLKIWDAEILLDNTIRFKSPDIVFDSNRSDIKPTFKSRLDNFFPRYLRILTNDTYKDKIYEVRIEGHTSSRWKSANTKEKRYLNNMLLSQNRAGKVLAYTYNITVSAPDRRWFEERFRANGMSSSKLIKYNNGQENIQASRRVEFRVLTKAEEKIYEIINKLK